MLDVMAGPDERDMSTLPPPPSSFQDAARMTDISDLRIGWSPTLGFATVDAEVAEITERAARGNGESGLQVRAGSRRFATIPVRHGTSCLP